MGVRDGFARRLPVFGLQLQRGLARLGPQGRARGQPLFGTGGIQQAKTVQNRDMQFRPDMRQSHREGSKILGLGHAASPMRQFIRHARGMAGGDTLQKALSRLSLKWCRRMKSR